MALKLTMSKEMIAAVMAEWERAHPGRDALEMGPTEMANRIMEKIKASAEIVPEAPETPTKN